MVKQLDSFKNFLETFAAKHQSDIKKNPEFRQHFQKLCSQIGVDPLACEFVSSSLFCMQYFVKSRSLETFKGSTNVKRLNPFSVLANFENLLFFFKFNLFFFSCSLVIHCINHTSPMKSKQISNILAHVTNVTNFLL